ncbi:MAG: hypothetical protein ACRDDX_09480 [Cellulosilyticaceae bacterium]
MKHKKLIVLITAIILLLSSIGIYGNTLFLSPIKGQVETLISFNYKGIDEGLNPHGGTFDIQQFKNDAVLEKTITDLELDKKGITKEVLAQSITLKAYVPKDVLERIMPKSQGSGVAQTKDIDGKTYHPTQYRVALVRTPELKISKKEAINVLDQMIVNYREDFISRYKDTQSLEAAIQSIDPARYDYSEYILLAQGQLEIMHKYLLAKEQVARGFKSQETGMRFSDLVAQVELLQDIEISNVNALVDTFMITNNKSELQSVYENRLIKLQRERDQVAKEKVAVAETLKTYEKDPTVILENGTVVSGVYKDEESDQSLYDELMQKSIDLETKYNNINYQIKYCQELLSKIQSDAQGRDLTAGYTKEVESTVQYIGKRIAELKELTIKTTDEYYEKEAFAECVTRTAPVNYRSAFRLGFMKNTFFIGIITMFGLIGGIIVALAKELFENKKQNS